MAIRHTITITFESHEDLLNHPVLEMLASDMGVQTESLTDGTYDEQEHGTEGKDTNVWNLTTKVQSKDITDYLSEDVRNDMRERVASNTMQHAFGDGMEEDYAQGGCVFIGSDNMTDLELIEELEYSADADDELMMRANAEVEVHKMLKGKS